MSEYDSLIEGYPGLDDPANDPGPLTDEEHQALMELTEPGSLMEVLKEEIDASQPITATEVLMEQDELRALRPDQRPYVGKHYVIFAGKPHPVTRSSVTLTEDEFVRGQLSVSEDLKDHDGQRQARADRTLRLRYRGYICGEVSSL